MWARAAKGEQSRSTLGKAMTVPAADHLWGMGEGYQNTVILRRMLTSTVAEIIWTPSSKKICFRRSLRNSNGIPIA